MTYRFLAAAQVDVFDAIDWYDARVAGLGQQFAEQVRAFVSRVLRHPRLHARVTRGVAGREFREGMLKVFPYRVVYEVTATEIVIYCVTHARAKSQPWRRRLPPNH